VKTGITAHVLHLIEGCPWVLGIPLAIASCLAASVPAHVL